ncbi:MAG TPA: STAS domain-containing protein [Terriglobales bacterium]
MLTIHVEKTGDVAVVKCTGRLVRGAEVKRLRTAVVSENHMRMLMLDLSEVDALDAGGLTALLALRQWARERGVKMQLVNPSHYVQEVLQRTQLDHIFEVSRFDHALWVLSGAECQHARVGAAA